MAICVLPSLSEKRFLKKVPIHEKSCPEPLEAALAKYSPRTKPIRIPTVTFAIGLVRQVSVKFHALGQLDSN